MQLKQWSTKSIFIFIYKIGSQSESQVAQPPICTLKNNMFQPTRMNTQRAMFLVSPKRISIFILLHLHSHTKSPSFYTSSMVSSPTLFATVQEARIDIGIITLINFCWSHDQFPFLWHLFLCWFHFLSLLLDCQLGDSPHLIGESLMPSLGSQSRIQSP